MGVVKQDVPCPVCGDTYTVKIVVENRVQQHVVKCPSCGVENHLTTTPTSKSGEFPMNDNEKEEEDSN